MCIRDRLRVFLEEFKKNTVAYSEKIEGFLYKPCEYKVLFRVIYCCGLRNNEACSLKIKNVDSTIIGI